MSQGPTMDRRQSIRLMIAACAAPAFVVNGLMRIKPVVTAIDWRPTEEMTARMLARATARLRAEGIPGPYKAVVHPDMYKDLMAAQDKYNNDISGILPNLSTWRQL